MERRAKKSPESKEKNPPKTERRAIKNLVSKEKEQRKTQQLTWIRRGRAKKNSAMHGWRGRSTLLKYIGQILLFLLLLL